MPTLSHSQKAPTLPQMPPVHQGSILGRVVWLALSFAAFFVVQFPFLFHHLAISLRSSETVFVNVGTMMPLPGRWRIPMWQGFAGPLPQLLSVVEDSLRHEQMVQFTTLRRIPNSKVG